MPPDRYKARAPSAAVRRKWTCPPSASPQLSCTLPSELQGLRVHLNPRVAVIFQHVVPLPRPYERSRRRSGAKVQIGCNDLQGADLSRRLLHRSAPKLSPVDPVSMGTTS